LNVQQLGGPWIPDLPLTWELRRFKHVGVIRDGQVDPKRQAFCNLPLYAPNHIESGTGRLIGIETAAEQGAESGKYPVQQGEIVYSKIRPALRKVIIAPEDGLCSADMYAIRPAPGAFAQFLFWSMLSNGFNEAALLASERVAMPKVNQETLSEFPIALPPIPLQTAIADFLDQKTAAIDALIEKKERLIELLAEKRAALIHWLVCGASMKGVKLAYVVDLLPGFAFSSADYLDDESGIPLLRGVNIAPGFLRWEDVARWPRDDMTRFGKWQLREGDIVLGLDRPWISSGLRVAQISEADCPALLLQRVARIRCGSEILPEYLLISLLWEQFRQHVEPDSTGISVPHISPGQVLAYRVPLPPVSEQAQIVRSFHSKERALRAARAVLVTQLKRLREYRQALITAAVTGQLDIPEASP